MKNIILRVKKILKNPFLVSSLVMIIGSNLFNAGQFLYHFITARFLEKTYRESLGKAYYGDIAAIISFLALVAIVQLSLGLTIVKFIASAKDKKAIVGISSWFYKWSFRFGLVFAFLVFLISPVSAKFLNITQPESFYVLAPILFFYILITTGRSILQGTLAFNRFVLSMLAEVSGKIIVTVIFISLGFAVFGVISAILIGVIISFLVTYLFIKKYLSFRIEQKPNLKSVVAFSLPVLLQGLALTFMYSTDLLLVKHFFSPQEAGLYAALSVLGRVAFFSASPVTHVMFPLIAKRHSHGDSYHNIFFLSVLLVSAISGAVIVLYYLFPKLPLHIYGASYVVGAPILWLFALFMGLLGLASLLIQFYLSINRIKVVGVFILAAILQAVLIWFFHDNLSQVVQVSILATALLVFSLLVYFPYHDRLSPKGFGATSQSKR